MDPKEQQNQNKEYVEWSEEAKKNMLELVLLLEKMEEEQKNMTEEEKERNAWAAWNGDKMLFKY